MRASQFLEKNTRLKYAENLYNHLASTGKSMLLKHTVT